MATLQNLSEFDETLALLGSGTPDAEQYQWLTTVVLDHPRARELADLDPFAPGYRDAVLDFYLTLRGRTCDDGYVPARDEAALTPARRDIWTGIVPWAFQDTSLAGEFLLSWGHICRLLEVKAGQSVLEYGPGSGQLLISLARMGVKTFGLDADPSALRDIRQQAEAMGLDIALETGLFGSGFGERRFDAIVFFEAFHHALDFQSLLEGLHDRLEPGGRLVLCGEPIVETPMTSIPYAWGPRLDALSVFCIRRYGWMELGFTRPFITEAARRAGWHVAYHPFPGCPRATAYVLTPLGALSDLQPIEKSADKFHVDTPMPTPVTAAVDSEIEALKAALHSGELQLKALRRSTSWQITRPLRILRRLIGAIPGVR